MEDINDAIDNLFNHPNTGPFLATRLIQRLVKSEPSPEYVERVASVFNDNGYGIRGDLKEVIRAILLDEEARDCSYIEEIDHGMLREPIIRLIHLLKAFNITNSTDTFYALGESFEKSTYQGPLRAPSVFNFFQSEYSAPGILGDSMVRSPEFQILDSYSAISYINTVDSIIYETGILDVEEGSVSLDFSEELELSSDEDLLDLLNKKLTYGNLPNSTRTIILDALSQLSEPIEKIKLAIYLISISPSFVNLK